MPRYAKIFFAFFAALVVAGAAFRAQRFLTQDPFANFKQADLFGDVGIRLSTVQVKHYSGTKLVGIANVDRIDVRQDRQYLDFYGIHNGSFITPHGPISFVADLANFNAITHELNVTSGGKVTNKDIAVTTPAFRYDQQTGILDMPGSVQGKFYDGNIAAQGLSYNATDKTYEIQTVRWVGTLPKETLEVGGGQASGQSRTPWNLSGHVKGTPDLDVYTDATATDGEVLIKAPRIERDKHSDVLTATGKVYYFSEKANLVCDKAVVFKREKRAVLTGDVHMLVKPKDQEKLELQDIPPFHPPVPDKIASARPAAPAPQEAQQQKDLDDEVRSSKTSRKYPMHVKADRIEYWYGKGTRHAIITGKPEAYQQMVSDRWRRVLTFKAFYDGENDLLTLQSAPGKSDTRMVNSIGDDLTAQSFKVSTKDDDETYEGEQVQGVVYSEEEDIPKGKPKGGTGTPAAAPPTAGSAGPPTSTNPPGQAPTPTTGSGGATPPKPPPAPTTGGGGGKGL
jgi:hypothetical protein